MRESYNGWPAEEESRTKTEMLRQNCHFEADSTKKTCNLNII